MFNYIIESIVNMNLWLYIFAAITGIFITLKNFKQDKTRKVNLVCFVIVMILGALTIISFISFLIFRIWYFGNLGNAATDIVELGIFLFTSTRLLAFFTIIFAITRLLILSQIKKKQ
ncbi:MAG: hypothetical protein FWF15_08855 [Oscillospiraceae bacterium]|nr:hypothetical protein [Oscillospiraceae bacterium]